MKRNVLWNQDPLFKRQSLNISPTINGGVNGKINYNWWISAIVDFAESSPFDTLCLNRRAAAPTFHAHRIPQHGQVWPLRAERQKEPRLNPPIPKTRQAGQKRSELITGVLD